MPNDIYETNPYKYSDLTSMPTNMITNGNTIIGIIQLINIAIAISIIIYYIVIIIKGKRRIIDSILPMIGIIIVNFILFQIPYIIRDTGGGIRLDELGDDIIIRQKIMFYSPLFIQPILNIIFGILIKKPLNNKKEEKNG